MTRRRRVVLDGLLVRRQPTGVGRSILELTAALAERDRGLDFTVLVTAPEMFAHLDGRPAWRVLHCPDAGGGTLAKAWHTQRRLPALCRDLGADLLHSLQFVAPLRLSCPSVVTVHDLGYAMFPQTVEEPRRTYYRCFVPPTLRRAAAVVTNSEATAQDVRRRHPRVADRVHVTPFGLPGWVDERLAAAAPAAAPPSRPYFLCVGTLEPRKNLEGVLAAYESFLAAADREASRCPALVFVGARGWRDSGLRAGMERLSAAGHLTVHDYCDPEGLWEHYRGAHALLFPSLHEGFGFPILEAMAAQLPVMTSDRGAMAEVAGDAALLVDPDSTGEMAAALSRLAWDEALRTRLRERGTERVAAWTWERTADRTCAVYGGVLGRTGGE